MPAEIPVQLPATEDDFFDNEIYRIELEFQPKPNHTNVQVRLRAKGALRYSIVIGNYQIGKLSKAQLARVQNKTLPASVKQAIAKGNLDDELIYRIHARRGKGEANGTAKGRRKGIRGSRLQEGARKGREVGFGDITATGRRQSTNQLRGITQSRSVN